MKWVTRERPKTDRIACPWLIKNFIDPDAEFLYVPADTVLEVAEREGAHSYDAPEAPGLDVLLRGLSMTHDDEHLLALTAPLFDALYEYKRRALLTGREPA